MEMATDLIRVLERATLMAKQLPTTTTATESHQIYASLHAAHLHLSLFLSHAVPPATPPPPQPSADEEISKDVNDVQMQLDDDDDQGASGGEQENSKMATVDMVEERMRDCSIQKSKRRKRSLSPPSVAAGERRRWLEYEIESARAGVDFDPHLTKLRALDLIYQFHC